MRRHHVLSLALVLAFTTSNLTSNLRAQDITVTLLGTGNPLPVMNRFGPSILVEAGGHRFLFDAGRGAMQRLWQVGTAWHDVDGLFFTHLHSDHIVGFPDLWLTGWTTGGVRPGRERPIRVWGPSGTKAMTEHLAQAYDFDIKTRVSDERLPPSGAVIEAEDIGEGYVFRQDSVTITAFEVDHGPVKPALGYRIDYRGRAVVLSGDTRASENLVRHAQGVDLLVHEVASPASFARTPIPAERVRAVLGHHVTPEEAGSIFAKVKPRLAVYSHIVLSTATEQDLVPPTRTTYSGPLEVGEDLMVIRVGETIDVKRPARPKP